MGKRAEILRNLEKGDTETAEQILLHNFTSVTAQCPRTELSKPLLSARTFLKGRNMCFDTNKERHRIKS